MARWCNPETAVSGYRIIWCRDRGLREVFEAVEVGVECGFNLDFGHLSNRIRGGMNEIALLHTGCVTRTVGLDSLIRSVQVVQLAATPE